MKTAGTHIIHIRPYTLKGLAAIWEVDAKTMKKWMKPYMAEIIQIGGKNGYYYSIAQVSFIISKLQLPSRIIVKDKEYNQDIQDNQENNKPAL